MTPKKVTIDPNDPIAKKAVYNLYRGILGNYNARANSIIDNLPRRMVTEDQGISKQLEGMARQSSQISGSATGNNQPAAYNLPNEIPKGPCIPASCPPPPPPPPTGGTVQPMRIKTEMRNKEPPAAIQNAMLTKDKKPFTYLPGGLDLSEIKSPRMARRIERNALTPDNPILPTPNSSQANSLTLPASAMAAMTPHLSVSVLPPVGTPKNSSTPPPPPPMTNRNQFNTLPRSSTSSSRGLDRNSFTNPQAVNPSENTVMNFTPNRESNEYNKNTSVSNQSPVATGIKQTPTSWLQRPSKQEQTNTAPWVRSNSSENVSPSNLAFDQSSRNFPLQVEVRPTIQNNNGTRVIPIQVESEYRSKTTSSVEDKRQGSNENQPTQNNANNTRPWMKQNTNSAENIGKQSNPVKISEAEYDSGRLPLNELRKLQLTQDDRAFMDRVKSQVDDDIFLHNETDPRYKGSVIPSRTFRMLQNMTDGDNEYRNASNAQQRTMNSQYVAEPKVETSPKYIPPSERRVVEDVRKYTGSAIPSRSFKVLQAITATQPTGYPDETDF